MFEASLANTMEKGDDERPGPTRSKFLPYFRSGQVPLSHTGLPRAPKTDTYLFKTSWMP